MNRYRGCFPYILFLFAYQFATAIAFKTAEDGDNILPVGTFSVSTGIFKIPVLSLMARSRRFITPPATKTSIKNSYQLLCCAEDSFQIVCTHDLSIPPELLCPVHGSKGRICRLKHNALNKNRNHSPHEENRTVSVVRCFRPPAVRLCRKANPYIIKQHFKGSVGIEAFQSFPKGLL